MGLFDCNDRMIAFLQEHGEGLLPPLSVQRANLWYIQAHYARHCHPFPPYRGASSHSLEFDPQTIER